MVAGGRLVDARDEVEDGGLAGAVGADEAAQLAFADREVHGVDGGEAAEADGGLAGAGGGRPSGFDPAEPEVEQALRAARCMRLIRRSESMIIRYSAMGRSTSGRRVRRMAARMTPSGVAHAAEDDHDDDLDALGEIEAGGRDGHLEVAVKSAGDAGEEGAERRRRRSCSGWC